MWQLALPLEVRERPWAAWCVLLVGTACGWAFWRRVHGLALAAPVLTFAGILMFGSVLYFLTSVLSNGYAAWKFRVASAGAVGALAAIAFTRVDVPFLPVATAYMADGPILAGLLAGGMEIGFLSLEPIPKPL